MADTSGITKIEDIVDRFIYMFKVQPDDHLLYMEHACAFYKTVRTHHAGGFKESKVAVDSLGFIDIPSDLIDIIELYLPKDGARWTFTRNDDLVTTTTTVDGADTFSTTYGEGTNIRDSRITSYGAVGAVNDYYWTPIWDDRQILVSGVTSANVTIRYKSSGLDLSGDTYVPALMEDAFMAKLKAVRAYIEGRALGERQMCEAELDREIMMLRKANLPSLTEIKDILSSGTTQAPTR